jgi:hypothetical protein
MTAAPHPGPKENHMRHIISKLKAKLASKSGQGMTEY